MNERVLLRMVTVMRGATVLNQSNRWVDGDHIDKCTLLMDACHEHWNDDDDAIGGGCNGCDAN